MTTSTSALSKLKTMLREGALDGGGVGASGMATAAGGGVGSGGRAGPTDSDGEGVGAEGGGGDVGEGSGATAGGGTGSVRTSTRVEGAAAGLAVRRVPVEVHAPRAQTTSSSHALDRRLVRNIRDGNATLTLPSPSPRERDSFRSLALQGERAAVRAERWS